jgi:hypothetical protein
MVAFCFLPIPGSPWTQGSVAQPLATTLGLLAAAGTSAQSELVATAISMAWVPALAALFAACCGSYYRERHSGFMPMKVLLWPCVR